MIMIAPNEPPNWLGPPSASNYQRRVVFHRFHTYPSAQGEYVHSDQFTCFGHEWRVRIYRGGYDGAAAGHDDVSLYLENMSRHRRGTVVDFLIYIVSPAGQLISTEHGIEKNASFKNGRLRGFADFINFRDVDDYLIDGSMVLEIHMRTLHDNNPVLPAFRLNLSSALGESGGDVEVVVANQNDTRDYTKRQKHETSFNVHSLILKQACPLLASMVDSSNLVTSGRRVVRLPEDKIKPEALERVLRYFYGDKLSKHDFTVHGLPIIGAAHYFGAVELKLFAESVFVQEVPITVDRLEYLAEFAETNECGILMEAVSTFFVKNASAIARATDEIALPRTAYRHLASAIAMVGGISHRIETWPIVRIQERLNDYGICVDGSRETLLRKLEHQWQAGP
ncbi:hypothetical protein THAOC_00105 [Thalassiosira oceanica]|uniref:MATH domain-containing protein n=1 Tax=Thalassiosira oceanica TaxID=159749 RepID=K0TK07_THAOC|nr:hypothetical protein THAOC_00105 [Thalassiosira oceanica]|mmetsp:Transcript_34310/g.82067  ORF Transcript_34310/g.82067 Transcript_34310/m.82067 type:complete len:395 (+) Transcript_34310:165-1349(+)|eukprot:EJK78020.1 hypothetical protein THAOC_00105 [Thalassiosira oceanica]